MLAGMGDIRITIDATGAGEGCGGDPNSDIHWCGRSGCAHCLARSFAASLKNSGTGIEVVRVEVVAKAPPPVDQPPAKEEIIIATKAEAQPPVEPQQPPRPPPAPMKGKAKA